MPIQILKNKGDYIMPKALDPKVKMERARARRNDRIVKLRNKNMTLAEIGETVGLTGPRVFKVLKKMFGEQQTSAHA